MFSTRALFSLVCIPAFVLAACTVKTVGSDDDKEGNEAPGNTTSGVAALGGGKHTIDAVQWDVIGNEDDGLSEPRDLDFNPFTPNELWVVNREDDSVVRYSNAGKDNQTAEHRIDSYAMHFMEEVSAISFSQNITYKQGNTFGTCQESENTYNDQAMGNGFMGPTLWTSDWEFFGFSNPEAVEFLGGSDLGSHIDMMHESPLCMGIGWERDNVYWTIDGKKKTISRYDFAEHHDFGYDDHSDGTVLRYTNSEYSRVEGVPSHIVFSQTEKVVYYADTGNGRVMRFDPNTATVGKENSSKDHAEFMNMEGGDLTVVADMDSSDLLTHPSGVTLRDDVLYVSDNATSTIFAIKTDGTIIDWLETGLPEGSIMGLRVDAEGSIWFVDNKANEVVRLRGLAK